MISMPTSCVYLAFLAAQFWRLNLVRLNFGNSISVTHFWWFDSEFIIWPPVTWSSAEKYLHLESRALSSNIASNHPQLPSSSSLSSSSSSSSTSSLSPQRTEVQRTIWSHRVNLTQQITKLMLQVQNLAAEVLQEGPFHLRLCLWWDFLRQPSLSVVIIYVCETTLFVIIIVVIKRQIIK